MLLVELMTKDECSLCEKVKEIILSARRVHPFDFREVDIRSNSRLYQRYKEKIPVVRIQGEDAFKYKLSERALIRKLVRVEKRSGQSSSNAVHDPSPERE